MATAVILVASVAVAALPVAEPALPDTLPVTSPVNAPVNCVAVIIPLEGLYVRPVSVSIPCVLVAPSTKTGYTVSFVELFALTVTLVASVAVATAILDVPSKEVPPIVLAFANAVAVAAFPVVLPELPEVFPVTFPVNAPTKIVEVSVPELGLYVNPVSDSAP